MKRQDEWDTIKYPTLTDSENERIRLARRSGFALFFPAVPDGETQDSRTLEMAERFLAERGIEMEGR